MLTADAVRLLEPTGGSATGSKLIPYTRSLQAEFRRAIHPWMFDLLAAFPEIATGSSYWTVSPPTAERRRSPGGVPVGFDSDASYLGRAGWLLRHVIVAPPGTRWPDDPDAFLTLTASTLLRRGDLVFASVWSPTFLSGVLDAIEREFDALVGRIHDGRNPLTNERDHRHPPDRYRARALSRSVSNGRPRYRDVWPRFRLLSAWADGPSAQAARTLVERLARPALQAKGLVATEGIVTIPIAGADGGAVPAYRSHFLEFVDERSGEPHLLHELESGRVYGVVLSTGGGLYRYSIGDRVLVTGRFDGLPLLRFVSRSGTSDMVGEKLQENHVESAFTKAASAVGVELGFAMLAPVEPSPLPGYCAYVAIDRGGENVENAFAREMEEALQQNFHYRHARRMGQLGPLRTRAVPSDAAERYLAGCVARGQRAGDVKNRYLDERAGWDAWLSS